MESRVKKSFLNARTNLIFYALVLGVTFISRRAFLEILGKDFVGLTTTLSNMLGLMNLAEMGVGAAIGYMLYKPLFERDTAKINQIISVFGYIYNRIGLAVLGIAVIVSCFLPLIFSRTSIPMGVIFFAYYSFLGSSLLSYFANYRQLLLGADQKQYVVTTYIQSANILRLLIQTGLAYYTSNLYVWVAMEMTFSVIYSIILNRRIAKTYPWLKSSVREGKSLFRQFPEVVKYTKQLFVHRLAGTALYNLSPVLIYAYTSLKMVAYYTNYSLIIEKVFLLITQIIGSVQAGVGHLVAQNDKDRTHKVYWELTALYYFIAIVVVISIYHLIDPFISLWIGKNYILPNITLVIILINLFIRITRIANESFIYAHGLFYDVWAPLTEAVINISLSIAGGIFLGLNGVLLGSTVSLICIVMVWKPYFLFRDGFKQSIMNYIPKIALNYLIFLFTIGATYYLKGFIPIDPSESYWQWIKYALLIFGMTGVISFAFMYVSVKGMRDITFRFARLITSRLRRS